MTIRTAVTTIGLFVLATLPKPAAAFQVYAPWTNLGDAETWYDIGPDWIRSPTAKALSAAPPSGTVFAPGLAPKAAPPAAPRGEFYAVTTVRQETGKAGVRRFVTIESRNTMDPGVQGCASGYGDLGMPSIAGVTNPGLEPGQPYWVSTPAVTDGWVFVTVVDRPRPLSNFQMTGRLFAKQQPAGAVDICSGWAKSWTELSLGQSDRNEDDDGRLFASPRQMPTRAGSAPAALTMPPGAPNAGATYVCVDPMHDFSQNTGPRCFVRRRTDTAWTPFGVIIDQSFGYPIGRPALAYDRCSRRVLLAATDTQTRRFVMFAPGEITPAGPFVTRDPTYKTLPDSKEAAGGVTLFQGRESCDISMTVRVAAQARFFATASPETERMGCRATGPGPSVGCVNGAEYMTATLPAGQRPDGAWNFSRTPLPVGHANRGVAAAFPLRGSDGAVVILDKNDKSGRSYNQFLVTRGSWSAPTVYALR